MNKKKIWVNLMYYTMFFLNFGVKVFASGGAADAEVSSVLGEVTQVILIVGAAVCIGKCIQIGIMYTLSSANEKSNAKMALVPWIIGTIVCFGAATIGRFFIDLIGGEFQNKDVLEY